MSINIGMHLGRYALLAADTRVVSETGAVLSEDVRKIHRTSMGLITGTGFSGLLDLVTQRLAGAEITGTDQIHEIIRESRREVSQSYESPRVREHADEATQWMFTYVAPGEDGDSAGPALRLAGWHPREQQPEGTLALCMPGRGFSSMPEDVTPEQSGSCHRALDSGMQLPEEGALFDNISHNAALAVETIRTVAGVSRSVSPHVQIGLHFFPRPATVWVSEILRHGTLTNTDWLRSLPAMLGG